MNTPFRGPRMLRMGGSDSRKMRPDIEVDGNISVHTCALLAEYGARLFVLGTASIFQGQTGPELIESLETFDHAVTEERSSI